MTMQNVTCDDSLVILFIYSETEYRYDLFVLGSIYNTIITINTQIYLYSKHS
jgi:hypothetical protein